MGATEHEGVDVRRPQGGQEPLREHEDLVGIDVPGLDELDESRAGGTGQLDTGDEGGGGPLVAPDEIVPTVPMTPIRPVRVALAAARRPGSITPIKGTS